MSRKRRRVPRYVDEAQGRKRESEREEKARQGQWKRWADDTCAAAEQERRDAAHKYWDSVDPATRLRQVWPFEISPSHYITCEELSRFKEIKLAALGYVECTILTWDEHRCHLTEGGLGSVASQEDAELLVSALTAEFPYIPFRIELMEELLENVEWRLPDIFLS